MQMTQKISDNIVASTAARATLCIQVSIKIVFLVTKHGTG
jgi:hypothetical protein